MRYYWSEYYSDFSVRIATHLTDLQNGNILVDGDLGLLQLHLAHHRLSGVQLLLGVVHHHGHLLHLRLHLGLLLHGAELEVLEHLPLRLQLLVLQLDLLQQIHLCICVQLVLALQMRQLGFSRW